MLPVGPTSPFSFLRLSEHLARALANRDNEKVLLGWPCRGYSRSLAPTDRCWAPLVVPLRTSLVKRSLRQDEDMWWQRQKTLMVILTSAVRNSSNHHLWAGARNDGRPTHRVALMLSWSHDVVNGLAPLAPHTTSGFGLFMPYRVIDLTPVTLQRQRKRMEV